MTGAVAESLRRVSEDLDRLGAGWALIGGFAVSARAEPRFTHDIDICVLVDSDEAAESVARAMTGLGYAMTAVVEHQYLDRLATLRLTSPVPGGVPVDLLFASSGVESETVAAAERLEILHDLVAPVATTAHLVVLKLLSRDDESRPQDAMDLRALRSVLSLEEQDEVRRLAALVMSRGFHRDRDLAALVEEYLA